MRNHHYLPFFAFIIVFSTSSCILKKQASDNWARHTTYMIPEKKVIQLSAEQKQFVDRNNTFGCRLFHEVQQLVPEKSVIVSPLSVTYLLGMLNAGAEGQTRDEITSLLGFGEDRDAINAFCKKMLTEAPFVDSGVTVETANAINLNSAAGITLQKDYEKTVSDNYFAQIEALNFGKDSSKKKINDWCKKHTQGMIPSIIDELDPTMMMVVLNAIYFKATWNQKFDPKDTRTTDFTQLDGKKTKKKLMHRNAYAEYGFNDDFSILALPYGDKGYCMYVLLPQEGKSTDDIISRLDGDKVNGAIRDMYRAEVDILLPLFTTESDTKLNDVLSKMGMPNAFAPNANFSKISNVPLYVSEMKQKAKIEVNEEGTKASAVTVAEMALGSAIGGQLTRPKKVDFHADRPFIYLIREMSTGTIFFMGKYIGV